jgi:hypothetical protein
MRRILLLKTMGSILLLNARGNMREPGESPGKSVPDLVVKQILHQADLNFRKKRETLKAQGAASMSIPSVSASAKRMNTIEGMIRTLAPIAIHQAAELVKTVAKRRRKPA